MKIIFFKPMTFLLFAALLLSGCATIVSTTSSPVYIRTNPAGASISITDKKGKEVYKGLSPAHTTLKSGAGYFSKAQYQVKLSAPGFATKTVSINYQLNGWYFGNIFLGGVVGMLIIDPITGAMWKIKNPSIDETLEKATTSTLTPTLNIVDFRYLTKELKAQIVRVD